MMDCINCKLENRIVVAENDIKEIQRVQTRRGVDIGKIETTLEYISMTLDDVRRKIEVLTEKPAKRWDTVATTAIAGIVSALVAAAMAMLLIKAN